MYVYHSLVTTLQWLAGGRVRKKPFLQHRTCSKLTSGLFMLIYILVSCHASKLNLSGLAGGFDIAVTIAPWSRFIFLPGYYQLCFLNAMANLAIRLLLMPSRRIVLAVKWLSCHLQMTIEISRQQAHLDNALLTSTGPSMRQLH